jgi:hypothetical protein
MWYNLYCIGVIMGTSRGREIMNQRLSNAAGIHRSTRTRTEIERAALKEELMTTTLEETFGIDDFWVEPTDDDLDEIENDEDYAPDDPDADVWTFLDGYDYDGYNASNYLEY